MSETKTRLKALLFDLDEALMWAENPNHAQSADEIFRAVAAAEVKCRLLLKEMIAKKNPCNCLVCGVELPKGAPVTHLPKLDGLHTGKALRRTQGG